MVWKFKFPYERSFAPVLKGVLTIRVGKQNQKWSPPPPQQQEEQHFPWLELSAIAAAKKTASFPRGQKVDRGASPRPPVFTFFCRLSVVPAVLACSGTCQNFELETAVRMCNTLATTEREEATHLTSFLPAAIAVRSSSDPSCCCCCWGGKHFCRASKWPRSSMSQ